MPKKFFIFVLVALAMLACGQDVDCPNTGLNVTLPPDGYLRDERIAIHRITVWATLYHQYAIDSSSYGTHDFCVTLDDPTIDRVDHVYGQLLDANGKLKYSMELELVPDLIGVYCHALTIQDRNWNDHEITTFRGWVVVEPNDNDEHGYFNYRETPFLVEVP